jgi:hypothetical protein
MTYIPIRTSADGNALFQFGDSPSIDGFGRARVSNSETLFDSKQIFDNAPLFWDDQETSGSGTSSSHSVDKAASTIGVSNSTTGTRVRQTFMRFNYQPGKSQFILLTGVMGTGASGITQRIGYFDDDNGLLFAVEDGTLKVVRRSNASGSPVDTSVAQASWNIDTMDGSGPSGITIDLTKTQIFCIDFEWLGVGRVRFGFVVDGQIIYCHELLNANALSEVYMSTPNLPLRYEISNDGSGPSATMDHICTSIISEGGTQDLGILRYRSTTGQHVNADVTNTQYGIIGLRLQSSKSSGVVKMVSFSMINATIDNYEWRLVLNPVLGGVAPTFADHSNSVLQAAIGERNAPGTTVTNGVPLQGGFVKSSGTSGAITVALENAIRLGVALDGTRDELWLVCRPLSPNADIDASITWRELL